MVALSIVEWFGQLPRLDCSAAMKDALARFFALLLKGEGL
jgi:hypothetical protein